jgi:hypothetical protein
MSFETLESLSDLEIYVKLDKLEPIESWLARHFAGISVVRSKGRTRTYHAQWQGMTIEIFLCRDAGHTGFSSVTFNQKDIPWHNDVDCAREACRALGVEIRCSESAWQEGDDPDLWYSVRPDGESRMVWKTE